MSVALKCGPFSHNSVSWYQIFILLPKTTDSLLKGLDSRTGAASIELGPVYIQADDNSVQFGHCDRFSAIFGPAAVA